jgi:glycerophosphoryl diester phosphodiesterase
VPFHFDGPVEIIAHRGFSARAPENTMVALTMGLEAGADGVEFDLHVAADGVPVLMHDETLARTTNGAGLVEATSVDAISRLDAGSWFSDEFRGEPVPTLEQALLAIRDRPGSIYAEVKRSRRHADLPAVAEVVDSAGVLDRTVFISMDWIALDRIRDVLPEAAIGYIVENVHRTEVALRRARGDDPALLDFDARILLANPHIALTCVEDEVPMACWTVNDVDTAARVRGLGVPRITTNEVALLVQWKRDLVSRGASD